VLTRFVLGVTAGLAAAVFLAFVLAYARLALFYPAWGASGRSFRDLDASQTEARAVRPPGRRHLDARDRSCDRGDPPIRDDVSDVLPPGWDSSFHLILAKKLALSGRMIFDWEPFENIALNYPLGSHILVAIVAAIARIPLHAAFKLLIPAVGVLSTALIYLFASRVGGRDEIGLFAALAYGMWPCTGASIRTGGAGSPTLWPWRFFRPCSSSSSHRPKGSRKHALSGSSLTSLALTITTSCSSRGSCCSSLRLLRSDRAQGPCAALRAAPSAAAAILGSFYLVPYAFKAKTRAPPTCSRSRSPCSHPHASLRRSGWSSSSQAPSRRRRRGTIRGGEHGTLHVAAAALLFLFVGLRVRLPADVLHDDREGGCRIHAVALSDRPRLRLAVYAGFAIVWAQDRFRLRPLTTLVSCLALALTTIPRGGSADGGGDPAPLFRAFQWIERNTPPDALVMNEHPWARVRDLAAMRRHTDPRVRALPGGNAQGRLVSKSSPGASSPPKRGDFDRAGGSVPRASGAVARAVDRWRRRFRRRADRRVHELAATVHNEVMLKPHIVLALSCVLVSAAGPHGKTSFHPRFQRACPSGQP
jgi:hypothetical protein